MTAVAEQTPVDFARQREVVAALRAFLPPAAVLWEAEDVTPYECDGLSAYRQVPMVVALPDTEERGAPHPAHLSRDAGAGRRARRRNGPVRAARCRSATACCSPSRASCAYSRSTQRARTARVQPGVRNLAISEAAAPHGLYYAPDPSSQIACSIGGNVAENSGGVHCLKYGLTVHNILKLRVATIEGDIAGDRRRRTRRGRLRSARAHDRVRRVAGRGDRGDGQAPPEAGVRAGGDGRVRRRGEAPATRSPASSRPGSSRRASR